MLFIIGYLLAQQELFAGLCTSPNFSGAQEIIRRRSQGAAHRIEDFIHFVFT